MAGVYIVNNSNDWNNIPNTNGIYLVNNDFNLQSNTPTITNTFIIGVTNDTTTSPVLAIDDRYTYYIPPNVNFPIGYFVKGISSASVSGYKCKERTIKFINPVFNMITSSVIGFFKFITCSDISTTLYGGIVATNVDPDSLITNVKLECDHNISINLNLPTGCFIGMNSGILNLSSMYIKYGSINVNSTTNVNPDLISNCSGGFIGASNFGIMTDCTSVISSCKSVYITSGVNGISGGFIGFNQNVYTQNCKSTLLYNEVINITSQGQSGGFNGITQNGTLTTNCESILQNNGIINIIGVANSGGFIGNNAIYLTNSTSTIKNNKTINISSNISGGFIGENLFSIIADCKLIIESNEIVNIVSDGTPTVNSSSGGFIGSNHNIITDCELLIKNNNKININSNVTGCKCGGFMGLHNRDVIANSKLTMTNNKQISIFTENGYNGGLVGYINNGQGTIASVTNSESVYSCNELINLGPNQNNQNGFTAGLCPNNAGIIYNTSSKFSTNKIMTINGANTDPYVINNNNIPVYNASYTFRDNLKVTVNGTIINATTDECAYAEKKRDTCCGKTYIRFL
ncbi:MAG: hypothetical protein Terrestrivirus1_199 [Terrestrivirus sp.]|uniref:Uncharacterized protein n=1 Tax=Terrestrivirus sp. TaxID=2487775 RepID=A0A3G4ZKF9_9VIRU|nr:MAG: hypothetical protein Terrestrivirus1_199 [Terrestrivirus sp.]